jgi:hypothetical protein
MTIIEPAKKRRRLAKRRWTSEDENKFRSMLDAGKTPDEIAVELKRTRGAIYSRLQRLYRMRPRKP